MSFPYVLPGGAGDGDGGAGGGGPSWFSSLASLTDVDVYHPSLRDEMALRYSAADQKWHGADLGRVITPEQFGAVGDGVANDTAAIQDAVDYAASLGGGLVKASRLYGWNGLITIKPGVTLEGSAVGQKSLTANRPGLLAIGDEARLRGGGGIGGVRHLFVDGADIAGEGDDPGDALVRFGFASNAHFNQLHVVGSKGNGVSFAGTQNSEVVGLYSHFHRGAATVLCGGAGAVTFVGGHFGTAARGLWIADGDEPSAYPFGPVQCTFLGTIVELYDSPNVTERIGAVEVNAGADNVFVGCNFTGNTHGTSNNAVIKITNNDGLPPSSIVLDSCIYALGSTDMDYIRVVGLQSVTIDGRHYAGVGNSNGGAFICQDSGLSELMINGYIQGKTFATMFRTINGGNELGWGNQEILGEYKRLRAGQASYYSRETDSVGSFRGYIDRDFTHAWGDATGGVKAAITHNGAGVIYNSVGMWQEKAAGAVVTSVVVNSGSQTVAVDARTTSQVNLGFAFNCRVATFTLANGVEGQRMRVGWFGSSFANSGANSIAWPAGIKWAPGRTAPVITDATNNGKFGSVDFVYVGGYWCELDRSSTVADRVLPTVKDAGIDPENIGLKATNMDPRLASGGSSFTLNAQVLSRVWVPAGVAIANVHTLINNAGSGVTASIAVYEADGTRSGLTASITTALHTAGNKVVALGSPIPAQQSGRWVWVSIVIAAGSSPTFARPGSTLAYPVTNYGQSPVRSGYISGSNDSTVDLGALTPWHEIWIGLS